MPWAKKHFELRWKQYYSQNKEKYSHPNTIEKVASFKATWLEAYVSLRVLEIRRNKKEFDESREKLIIELKKAQLYDRRKVWKQLKRDLQEIQRMHIAA